MKIIIIGAGKVGCQIAKTLSSESHDVILIEKDNAVRQSAQNSLDVLTILGNRANVHTLEESEIKQADMLTAVTNSDEANILACITAKQYGVPQKVARIRNIEYIHNNALSREQLGIDFEAEIIELIAQPTSKIINKPLKILNLPKNSVIEAIVRQDKAISEDVIRNITEFFFLYILIFVICTFIMSLLELDILSTMASVAATLGNVGPGLGLVGPVQNYAFIPPLGKITLILCMLLGRLEIYTVLILVVPEFWRK